jgi:hypothetical protein
LLQQLGQVGDDDVGAVLEQGLPLSGAVDSDDEAEVPRAPGLDSRQCVLETAASAGSTPSSLAAVRNVSGAGFPRKCFCSTTIPSMRTSNRSSIPAASRTSLQFALADTTAVWSPASRTAWTYRTEPS